MLKPLNVLMIFGMLFGGGQLAAQDSKPSASTAPLPLALTECDGDQCTRGGGGSIWLFEGKQGRAMWRYGAVADLTVESFDGSNIVIRRTDPVGSYSNNHVQGQPPTKPFTAVYTGVVHGDRIDGTVSWGGPWYAVLPKTLCDPFAECPLEADQLVQLGQNALNAKLYTSALRCFIIAGGEGNADAQSSAGIMIRDGIGTAANPEKGLAILQDSAAHDSYTGELALSQSYELGIGVAKDPEKAEFWKNKAIARVQMVKAQQARQQQQAELLTGLVILGAIAALFGGNADADDSSSAPSPSNNRALANRAEWYSRGGSNGGPPPTWNPSQPVPH
jgi:hypothetical protein